MALRRQQAQEENEARELGLLYTSVPGSGSGNQQNGGGSSDSVTPTSPHSPPHGGAAAAAAAGTAPTQNGVFHGGIPSPPSDGYEASSTPGQHQHQHQHQQHQHHLQAHRQATQLYNGNESDTDGRTRSEHLSVGFSPTRTELDESPGKSRNQKLLYIYARLRVMANNGTLEFTPSSCGMPSSPLLLTHTPL